MIEPPRGTPRRHVPSSCQLRPHRSPRSVRNRHWWAISSQLSGTSPLWTIRTGDALPDPADASSASRRLWARSSVAWRSGRRPCCPTRRGRPRRMPVLLPVRPPPMPLPRLPLHPQQAPGLRWARRRFPLPGTRTRQRSPHGVKRVGPRGKQRSRPRPHSGTMSALRRVRGGRQHHVHGTGDRVGGRLPRQHRLHHTGHRPQCPRPWAGPGRTFHGRRPGRGEDSQRRQA